MLSGPLCLRTMRPNRPIAGYFGVALHCALTVLVCAIVAAGAVNEQFKFDHWTTDDGLPQNTVRQILQTTDGYLWFPTLDGLVRFDGVRFKVFNKFNSKDLPSNRLVSLFAQPDDTLWISTDEHGAIRYRDGVFTNFTTADGLPANRVFRIEYDLDGNLTALTGLGRARFDGVRFIPTEDVTESLSKRFHTSSSGTRWQLDRTALTSVRAGQRTTYQLPDALAQVLRTEGNVYWMSRLFELPDGELLITVNYEQKHFNAGRIFRLSGQRIEEMKYDNMPRGLVSAIETDRHGAVWMATTNGGACRLINDKFECYTRENGLLSDDIRDIFRDREGTLWLTTENKGICRVSEKFITPMSTAQGLPDRNVYAIFRDSLGAVWIGSLGKLARYHDGVVKEVRLSKTLEFIDIQAIFEDRDGRIWVGARGGVYFFRNNGFDQKIEKITFDLDGLTVYDIHQDPSGAMWFGSNFGLIKREGDNQTVFTTSDGLPNDNVRLIQADDDGSLWLGTFGGISVLRDGKFTNYGQVDGLAGDYVRSFFKDETGALWIGTYDSGISRFKDGKFTNFTMDQGLSSNGAFQIFQDSEKNLWISSNQGIYRVNRTQLEEYSEGKRSVVSSTRFGMPDGMLSTEANGGAQPAGLQFNDGKLWFPTQDGVAIVDTSRVRTNELPPPVVIEEVRLDNTKVANVASEITILPDQGNLEIDYTGLSFIKPEQVQFRFKLEGLDEQWREAKDRRTAFYPHLDPGEYVFRVIAANSDNVWNEDGASIRIVVLPPFYLKWWFIVLSFLTVAAIVFWVNHRRVEAVRRKHSAQEEFSRRLIEAHETERRRVAAELHDSLGQTLAMIKNRAVFARQNPGDFEKAMAQFELITEQSVDAINEVREISYNLRPYLLERLGLTKALKSLFKKTAENSELKIKAELESIDKIFTPEEEMSLYRIIQESLNNILKHADAKNVEIEIIRTETALNVSIRDDGRGFSKDARTAEPNKGGFGLLGMTERIKILGGTLRIESAIGKGTAINVSIDLSKRNKGRTNG